jgi:single-strand DNA-binding protein
VLNKVMLIGRLGRDPAMRFLPDGKPIAQFSIATDRTWRDEVGEKKTETDWHQVVAWNKLAEVCGKFLAKGKLVYVEGRLQSHMWEEGGAKRYRTEVVAEVVRFLDKKPEDSEAAEMPVEDLPF